MKTKILLVFFALFSHYTSCFAQGGSDFLICIDNSGSISDPDFEDIRNNSLKVIHSILDCNPNNRVSVVHYGTGVYNAANSTYEPRIYIEYDFTNNFTIAQNFTRRLSFGDHFHEALGLIGNALDNVANANIVSPQANLNHNPAVPLNVILYTDAERASGSLQGGSYLVNYFNPTFNSSAAFENVTSFKNDRDAKFIIVHKNSDPDSMAAAATIASGGGSYGGNLENYSGDPDYGLTPKLYFNQPSFQIDPSFLDLIIHDFCNFNGSMKFFYELAAYCTNPANPSYQTIEGEFLLPIGATPLYMKCSAVNTVTNYEIPVNFNPTITGNTFSYYIQPTDISPVPTSGTYDFRVDLFFDYGGNTQTISSWNSYPDWYWPADINYDNTCSRNGQVIKTDKINKTLNRKIDRDADPNNLSNQSSTENAKTFKLFPNPNNGVFNILMDKVKTGRLEITDINGKHVYSDFFENKNTFSVNLKNKNNGIYFIKITDSSGEISMKKIIINK
ncbi:T9SS type A sorting domain-containing protein [Chryseobacterium scophthalmum]|uniref:T9SS type A sorting domain-containing protein n=1 Tax=Chryseobacterium scophthalmum TaxID=59733 RepID=UPI000FABCBAB